MKRISFLLLVLIVAICVNAQHTYVLLTGVSNYNDPKVENLHLTTKDVKLLKQVFDKQSATTTKVLTGKYATHDNITKNLKVLVQHAKPEDKIIFFFSGHGSPGAFVVYGTSLFQYTDLIRTLSAARTKNVFCFIDACMTGSVASTINSTYGWGSDNKITFVMSSRADETSIENPYVGQGFFTQALVKALRGQADTNSDRRVTLLEAFKYLHADVVNSSLDKQHPQLIGPKERFNTVITKW